MAEPLAPSGVRRNPHAHPQAQPARPNGMEPLEGAEEGRERPLYLLRVLARTVGSAAVGSSGQGCLG